MLMKLYARFDVDELTNLDKLKPTDYPVMEDLYNLIEKEYMIFDHEKKHLYTEETYRTYVWDCTPCAKERKANILTVIRI